MDITSPLLIKKLNFIDNTNTNPQEKNQTTTPTTTTTHIQPLTTNPTQIKCFFDNISNLFIKIFNEEQIEIWNKTGTILKKTLNIKFNIDKINSCAIEKKLKHLLIQFDNKMILIINVRTEKVSDILHFDFTNLLGMAFVKNSGNFSFSERNSIGHNNNNAVNESNFFLIFPNKMNFFKISGVPNENVRELKMTKFNTMVTNALFNLRFEVLLLEKGDKNFEFYNLSNEKFYTKPHFFNLGNKKNKENSGLSKFFGFFSAGNSEEKNISRLSIAKDSILFFTYNFLFFLFYFLFRLFSFQFFEISAN